MFGIRTPCLHFHFRTGNQQFRPGFEPDSVNKVALETFEYTDPWAKLDMMSMTFDDPYGWLIEEERLRPLVTQCVFSFGYQDELTSAKRMTLARLIQKYPENGRIQTELVFLSQAMDIGSTPKNARYLQEDPKKRGQPLLASEVATMVANINGLRPVITPCAASAVSSRVEWKQHNETDLDFLQRIADPLHPANGTDGKYFVMVRNGELFFGPLSIDMSPRHSFTYRAPSSFLRSFSPQLPADMLLGAAYIAGMAGMEPAGGEIIHGYTDPQLDTDRTNMGPFIGVDVVTHGKRAITAQQVAPMVPLRRNPSAEVQRREIEEQIRLLKAGIKAAENVMRNAGVTPAEIAAATTADYANLKTLTDSLRKAESGDFSSPSPFEPVAQHEMKELFEMAMLNSLTATANLWGYPRVRGGDPVNFAGVFRRFSGKWWVREVKHRIDRGGGFATTLDMQKNALGMGDPTGGSQANTGALIEVVGVGDAVTHEKRWEVRPTQAFFDIVPAPSQTRPTFPFVTSPIKAPSR